MSSPGRGRGKTRSRQSRGQSQDRNQQQQQEAVPQSDGSGGPGTSASMTRADDPPPPALLPHHRQPPNEPRMDPVFYSSAPNLAQATETRGRMGLNLNAAPYVPRNQPVVEPGSEVEDAPEDMREGQPGSRSANFGDRELLIPSMHAQGSDGQVDEATSSSAAEESWLEFVRHRCQNVLRVSRDNSVESNAQLKKIAKDLERYKDSDHRGRDAILPTKPALETRLAPLRGPRIYANHFRVHLRQAKDSRDSVPIVIYSITWTPDKLQKAQKVKLWADLMEKHGRNPRGMNGILAVYDGAETIISPKEYAFDKHQIKVGVDLNVKQGVEANIKWKETVDHKILEDFLKQTRDSVFPKALVLSLNLITKQYCIHKDYIESGRFYFAHEHRDKAFTTHVLDSMPGYFQSVRALQAGLMINVDVMSTAFYKSGMKLVDLWTKMIRSNILPETKQRLFDFFDRNQALEAEQVAVIREYWKNLQIQSAHRRYLPVDNESRIFSVFDVSNDNAENKSVPGQFANTDKTFSLVKLLDTAYNYHNPSRRGELLVQLPVIKVSKKFEYYLPWGCCQTTNGSRYGGKLEDRRLLEKLAKPPAERYESIATWMKNRQLNANPNSDSNPDRMEKLFGIDIEDHMVPVTAPLALKAPIMLGGKNSELKQKKDGSFTMDGVALWKPMVIQHWGLLRADSRISEADANQICEDIRKTGWEKGWRWGPGNATVMAVMGNDQEKGERPSIAAKRQKMENLVRDLMTQFDRKKNRPAAKLDLIICLMTGKMTPEYSTLKYLCDTIHGVPTQVVKMPYDNNGVYVGLRPGTGTNLMLKINVKCGGVNFTFSGRTKNEMTLLDSSTMLLGADVTHPPGGDPTVPSIAAVVATTNEDAVEYACRIQAQTSKKEAIEGLQTMVGQLLEVYKDKARAGRYPNRIFFFRDGVSETQFFTTLREEGVAILDAAKSKFQDGREYKPQLFIMLAVKRHHTRFFKLERQNCAAQNITEGTLVQDTVTHPREFDFYLCSQGPGKGTSRATHYHVLLDQINVGRDELYTLVYNLCYSYQRCTKAVSLVTPVYYAHLAAFRAKQYMEYYVAKRRHQQQSGGVVPAEPKEADFNAHEDLRDRLWFV